MFVLNTKGILLIKKQFVRGCVGSSGSLAYHKNNFCLLVHESSALLNFS